MRGERECPRDQAPDPPPAPPLAGWGLCQALTPATCPHLCLCPQPALSPSPQSTHGHDGAAQLRAGSQFITHIPSPDALSQEHLRPRALYLSPTRGPEDRESRRAWPRLPQDEMFPWLHTLSLEGHARTGSKATSHLCHQSPGHCGPCLPQSHWAQESTEGGTGRLSPSFLPSSPKTPAAPSPGWRRGGQLCLAKGGWRGGTPCYSPCRSALVV